MKKKHQENYETPELFTSTESQKLSREGEGFLSALVVIGDGEGRVGLGYGKAKEVPLAIQKGTEEAKRNLFRVPMAGSTVTHPIIGENGAGRVMLKPAAPGTGVIAGGAARIILEEAGIRDVLCKSLGSPNHINVARATMDSLRNLQRPDQIANLQVSQQKSSSRECSLHKESSALFANWRRTKMALNSSNPFINGIKPEQRGTLRALGLGRIGKSHTLPDKPEIRGMINTVPHLIEVKSFLSNIFERNIMKIHDLQPPEGSNRGSKRSQRNWRQGGRREGDQGQRARNTVESDLRVADPLHLRRLELRDSITRSALSIRQSILTQSLKQG